MDKKTKRQINKIKHVWVSKKYDPNGSYTGNGIDFQKPVQDQDDL